MLRFLIKRPIAVFMSTVGCLVLGLVFFSSIPISLLPDVPVPKITVYVNAPNTTARVLENTVTRIIRNQLLQINHLRDIRSVTRNGSSTIELDLAYGTNTTLSFIEINEKIDLIQNILPRDLERPRVIKSSIADLPVLDLSVIPKDPSLTNPIELADFTEKIIKRRLEQLEEVAFVDRHGYAIPEIHVIPEQRIMRSLGISEDQLSAAIVSVNVEFGNVIIKDGQYQYSIRLNSRLESREDVENVYLNMGEQLFQLKDLADVRLAQREPRSAYLYNDHEAVLLNIRKQPSANNFVLKDKINELIVSFRKDYPQLDFEISNDQSELLEVSYKNLRSSLGYGLLFASLIMFLFFREWRLPLLIIVVIPTSLIIILLFFYLLNVSLNIISLSGLILGIGLMIDNSIIIIENIRQKVQKLSLTEACVEGTNEVIRPLISSALTSCSVFLPLILLSGLAGSLFLDLALSVSIALMVSLVVSYFLLPVLANRILINLTQEKRTQMFDRLHESSLHHVLRFRWMYLILFFGVIVSGYWWYGKLDIQSFPPLTRKAINLNIDWNENISLEENKARVIKLVSLLDDYVTTSNSILGEIQFLLLEEEQSINEAEIVLVLSDSVDYEHTVQIISQKLLEAFPRSSFVIKPQENVLDVIFQPDQASLTAHLQAINQLELPPYSEFEQITNRIREIDSGIRDFPQETFIAIEILSEKLLLYNVSYEAVLTRLMSVFNENEISTLRATDRYIPIKIGTPDQHQLNDLLRNTFVYNNNRVLVPINDFISISQEKYYKTLKATRSGESIDYAFAKYEDNIIPEVQSIVNENGKFSVFFSGQYFKNRELFKEMMIIFCVVIALLFLILAAQFESYFQPVIVLMTVPVSLTGALLFLWLFGQTINIVAIVGVIVTSGIVVNDAILKVDMINRGMRDGMKKIDAIQNASHRRLRPIVMTSLTTILAVLPIIFTSGIGAELQAPLVYVLIGGLSFGTIASLIFIPLIYQKR